LGLVNSNWFIWRVVFIMFYSIEKMSIGGSDVWIGGVKMKSMEESDYRECVMGLSKMLSDDGRFIISEDENFLYMKGIYYGKTEVTL